MTGAGLLGLVLISMAWLFFLGGLAANFQAFRRSLRAKAGERAPSGLGFLPGVVGSLAVFFTIPALARQGVEMPWPWLWILLPMTVDPYCLPGLVALLLKKRRS